MTDLRPQLFYENTAHEEDTDDLYAVLAPISTEDGGHSWTYDTDKEKSLAHLPASNTLFINSNIALTDGTNKEINKTKTIPNLYDAIDGMSKRIKSLEDGNIDDPSTADRTLLVTPSEYVQCKDSLQRPTVLTIRPGTNGIDNASPNAAEVDSHIKSLQISNVKGDSVVSINGDNQNGNAGVRIRSGDSYINVNHNGIVINGDTIVHVKGVTQRSGSEPGDGFVSLQAIVEAIQELHRRTAFIDSSLGFKEALKYHDTIDGSIEGVYENMTADKLPAATDSFVYDSDRSMDAKTINETDELAMEDDPTVIMPENAAIRFRGCPYLIQ